MCLCGGCMWTHSRVCIRVHAEASQACVPQSPSTIVFETRALIWPGACRLFRQASQLALGILQAIPHPISKPPSIQKNLNMRVWMSLIGSDITTLGFWLVVLFRGDGIVLPEVCPWRWALRVLPQFVFSVSCFWLRCPRWGGVQQVAGMVIETGSWEISSQPKA